MKGKIKMFEIEYFKKEYIDDVCIIEDESFNIPWSRNDFENELFNNENAIYIVALDKDKVVGYAGMWHILDEGHITNVAVKPDYRGKGIGDLLVNGLIEIAQEQKIVGITLEVRQSNLRAQNLYVKHGFRPKGFRKRYYTDLNEDAIIMWKYF